jgi:general nucleoside transport system ATP-binding protein
MTGTPPGAARADSSSRALAVRMNGIEKSFGSVRANRGASLEVAAGEIHALVGENGAGKSTLMRILAGTYAPDAGTVEVADKSGTLSDVTGWNTALAIAAGVGMVHQHFMLVPPLTVAENVVLGLEPRRHGQIDREAAEQAVAQLAQRSGLIVPANRRVAELSVGEAQRVEILKALFRGARVLVLDEPTAVLSPPEVRQLWDVLRRLRDDGGTIVLITHKLDEVMDVSETITVMRAGETVARLRTNETSPAAIAKAMVGRDVALALDSSIGAGTPRSMPNVGASPALEVRGLRIDTARKKGVVNGISFTVAPGEILGIAGVEGNGQTELVEAIAGLTPVAEGTILLDGTDFTTTCVRDRGDSGLSHVPEDRHRRGLILDYTIADNLILGRQHHFTRRGALDTARIMENARTHVAEFDIRPGDPALTARALSGGNQQKIVVAREMGRDFRVLLAAQPTRGVDVGAIEFIYDRIRRARDEGKAILLVSADLAEVLTLSDRIAVMYGGKFVTVLPRSEASAEVLGPFMTGASGAGARVA